MPKQPLSAEIHKIVCEAIHKEAAGSLIGEAASDATEKILKLTAPLQDSSISKAVQELSETTANQADRIRSLVNEIVDKNKEIAELQTDLKGQIDKIPMDEDLKRMLDGAWEFGKAMMKKLSECYHDGKGGWEEASPHYLLARTVEEIAELVEASSRYKMIGLLSHQLNIISDQIKEQEKNDESAKDNERVFRKDVFTLSNRSNIASEAIDVANFAYFIWARCQNEYRGGRTEDFKEGKS